MTRIIFLCTENTCRSQMAEGFAEALGGKDLEIHNSGIKAEGFVNPLAEEAMKETGLI